MAVASCVRSVASRCASAAAVAACLAAPTPVLTRQTQPSPAVSPAVPIPIDVTALDANGANVTDLSAAEFAVRIDGQPRRVVSVQYVHRGPTAEAAARAARAGASVTTAAERQRTVLFAIDEQSIVQEDEKLVLPVMWRLLEVFAPDDQLAVISLPEPHGRALLSTDRQTLKEALGHVVGQGVAASRVAGGPPSSTAAAPPELNDEQDVERPDTAGQRQAVTTGVQAPTPAETGPAPTRQSDTAGETRPTPLQALVRLVGDLKGMPGRKHVVFVSAGTTAWSAAEGARGAVTAAVLAATDARVAIHVVHAPRGGSGRTDTLLDRLAEGTGGTVSKVAGSGADFSRLKSALAGSYVVEVEGTAGPTASVTSAARTLDVSTTRTRTTLLAPTRWVPRTPASTARAALPTATGETRSMNPDGHRSSARTAIAQPPPVSTGPNPADALRSNAVAPAPPPAPTRSPTPAAAADVHAASRLSPDLARLADYVDDYLAEFSSVVMEEDYVQRVTAPNARTRYQHLKSDLLLVRTSGAAGWVPFRDVFEVNDKPVRDREDRLRRLFIDRPDTAMAEGRRLTDESARYNIGSVYRTINVPTMGLVFFSARHLPGLHIERQREETLDGVAVTRYDFLELARPAIVRQQDTDKDLPSSGSVWVERASDRVVKTTIRTGDERFRMEATVTYKPADGLPVLVPSEMNETYRMLTAVETTYGTAKYSKFRRFTVSTEETTQLPK